MASSNIYSSLEPGAQSILGSQASFTIGQTGSLGDIFNLISRLGVTVLFLAFFTMLVYAFSKRIAVLGELSDKNISDSKKIATRAIYSFLITIGCFALIAKTVNPILSTDNILFSALSVGVSKGVEQGVKPSESYTKRLESHNYIAARLGSIKTNHNNIPCTEVEFSQSTPSCTSLAFLPEQTIQMLLKLNDQCNAQLIEKNTKCNLVISGATEPGHAVNVNHGENKRAVDLQIRASQDTSDPLYSFIIKNSSARGSNSNCYATYVWGGYTFCDEKPRSNSTWGPHFHVD